jgi:hypothetical protein
VGITSRIDWRRVFPAIWRTQDAAVSFAAASSGIEVGLASSFSITRAAQRLNRTQIEALPEVGLATAMGTVTGILFSLEVKRKT